MSPTADMLLLIRLSKKKTAIGYAGIARGVWGNTLQDGLQALIL
jgi:hypothetical protein